MIRCTGNTFFFPAVVYELLYQEVFGMKDPVEKGRDMITTKPNRGPRNIDTSSIEGYVLGLNTSFKYCIEEYVSNVNRIALLIFCV